MHRLLCLVALVAASILAPGGAALATDLVGPSPLDAAGEPALADVEAKPASPQAGARANFDVGFRLRDLGDPTGGDDLRDLELQLPAGLLGAITAADECTFADLRANRCAAATRLGRLSTDVSFRLYSNPGTGRVAVSSAPAEVTVNGTIHRAPIRGSEPARLAIVLVPAVCVFTVDPECTRPTVTGPPVVLESPVAVRTAGDGGLTATVADVPRNLPMSDGPINGVTYDVDIAIERMAIRLLGTSGRGDAFMTNPTTCDPATTVVTATTYDGARLTASPSFTPTGCGAVPFDPTVALQSSAAGADLPTEATVTVGLPYSPNPATVAQTQPRRAVVRLPQGFELSPTVGSAGLEGCTDAQFDRGGAGPSSCPAGAQVGSVRFTSPLIADPIPGRVFIARPEPGGPPLRIFIVAEQSGAPGALRIKLEGVATPDPETGQVTTTLEGIPPLAFTTFTLTFRGGDHAVFSTPRTCGRYTTSATFTPHSGGADASPSSTTDVSGDCPDPSAFTPSATVSTAPNQAGAFAALTTVIERPDRQARLRSLQMSLPPGLLGKIPGVAQCDLAAARTAACPEDSRVGTVTALAGPGAAPLSVSGPVYLTPSIDGSFAGLAIVVPAKVGPIDLGTTVTLARLRVRPADQGLDVEADGIPLRQGGVAFSIRQLRLALDRPGFTLAPTSCDPLPVRGAFTSDLGGTGASETTYQAGGCEGLPFAPKMAASLGDTRAQVAEGGHPSFTADVTQAPGQAGMKSVEVTLPAGVSTDPVALGAACPAAVFAQGACPQTSVAGTVRAETPLLATPLEGRVLFVAQAGGGLPDLRVQLRGELAVDLVGKVRIAPGGQIVTEFDGVPDVPISRFTLRIGGGARGLLVTTRDMCTSGPKLASAFTAHSGARSAGTGAVAVEPCSAVGTLRVSSLAKGRPAVRLRVDGAGRKLSTTQLTLPRGLTLDTRRARRLVRVQATGMRRGAKATVRVRRGRLDVTFPRGGADRATVTLRPGALRVTTTLRKARRPQLRFGLRITQPGIRPVRSTLRTRPVPRL